MDPRKARSRQAVLEAATALLAEGGIRAFSVDAVAARSGVAKTTIYRQWATRGDLLQEVYGQEAHTETPDLGSLREDLAWLLRDLAKDLKHADWARNLTAVVAEGEHDPDIARAHAQHAKVESQPLRTIFQRAVERGEMPDDLDLDLVVEHAAGALFYRRLVLHRSTTRRQVDLVVDLILHGVTSPAHRPPQNEARP